MLPTRNRAAALAAGTVVVLIAAKAVVAALTGSLSITAQATDSFLDLISVAIMFFAVRAAVMPPDEEHPFGHGKMESIAAVAQAVLIFAASGLILYAAVRAIVGGAAVHRTEAGMGVMVFSMITSGLLARYLLRKAGATGSLALEAFARNLTADVYSAAGVLAGMAAIRLTGLVLLDAVIAIGVAGLILKSAYDVVRKSVVELTDVRLPEEERALITGTINEHSGQVAGFHAVRSRKAGTQRFLDLHLVMPRDASLQEAHDVCDHLEADISARLPGTSITVHVEPCRRECEQCHVDGCDLRRE